MEGPLGIALPTFGNIRMRVGEVTVQDKNQKFPGRNTALSLTRGTGIHISLSAREPIDPPGFLNQALPVASIAIFG